MESLDAKIVSLEAKIERYDIKLNSATGDAENMWLGLITSCINNLTELLKQKNLQSEGNLVCFYQFILLI